MIPVCNGFHIRRVLNVGDLCARVVMADGAERVVLLSQFTDDERAAIIHACETDSGLNFGSPGQPKPGLGLISGSTAAWKDMQLDHDQIDARPECPTNISTSVGSRVEASANEASKRCERQPESSPVSTAFQSGHGKLGRSNAMCFSSFHLVLSRIAELAQIVSDTSLFLSRLRTQGHMRLETLQEWDELEVLHNRLAALREDDHE